MLPRDSKRKWACPYCNQTSSRHWNLKIHIERLHDKVGDPIRVKKEPYADMSHTSYNYHQRGYSGSQSFHSKAVATKDDSLGWDILDTYLPPLRKCAEFLDLIRKISPQRPLTMDNMLPWLILLSSSNLFQNSNRKSGELPVGYRIRVCNNCLPGNCLEPVFGPLELEALTKTKHICRETGTAGLSTIQQNMAHHLNNIREVQEIFLSYLRQLVKFRISQQQGQVGMQLRLSAREFVGPQVLFQHVGKKKLPGNKSWIEEENYIDLGKISQYSSNSNVEQQSHWVYRLFKEEGLARIIKINESELPEFIGFCKATFGILQIRIDHGITRYCLVSIVL